MTHLCCTNCMADIREWNNMISEEIEIELLRLRDEKYKDFQIKLIPTISYESFIGVRTPELKRLAKSLGKREDIREFLMDLPHRYFDEDQLHAFIISDIKDYEDCIKEVTAFLPYVNNWATCDQMSPKVFKKHRSQLIDKIRQWICAKEIYTIRFGVGMLMQHFLDDDFDPVYPEIVANISSDEYYVNMMIAWYFATALAKQYDAILPFIEGHRLADWTHNKAIQKAVESRRITDSQKARLKELKVGKKKGI